MPGSPLDGNSGRALAATPSHTHMHVHAPVGMHTCVHARARTYVALHLRIPGPI